MEVDAAFAPDTERMLRGLMIICGVSREEIESLLKRRRNANEMDQTEGLAN